MRWGVEVQHGWVFVGLFYFGELLRWQREITSFISLRRLS
jgi:hypothetical protein